MSHHSRGHEEWTQEQKQQQIRNIDRGGNSQKYSTPPLPCPVPDKSFLNYATMDKLVNHPLLVAHNRSCQVHS